MSAFLPPVRRAALGSAAVLSLGLSALLGGPALAAETAAPETAAPAASNAAPSETAASASAQDGAKDASAELTWDAAKHLRFTTKGDSQEVSVDSAEAWSAVKSLTFDETQIPTGWSITIDDAGTIHVTWPAGLSQTPEFSVDYQVLFTDGNEGQGTLDVAGELEDATDGDSAAPADPTTDPSEPAEDEGAESATAEPSETTSAAAATSGSAEAQGQAAVGGAAAAPAAESTPSGYQNCGEVWDARGGSIMRGEPGFTDGLDADGDDEGCEIDPGYHGGDSAGGYGNGSDGQNGAVDTTGSASEALASTGTQHTGLAVGVGLGGIALGSATLMAGRRRRARG